MDTGSNDLCSLCLRALTIDDQLAGGTTRVDTSNGRTVLDLSGFERNDWQDTGSNGTRTHREARMDAFGWRLSSTGYGLEGSRVHRKNQYRRFCAGDHHKRLVTVPSMLELPESAVGTCQLCSTLRALFEKEYKDCTWWNNQGSILRFTLQYEWSEFRTIVDYEDEATVQPSGQRLISLAVLVFCPDQEPNEADVYEFDVVAWPGSCQEWLGIETTPLDPDGPMSDRNVGFMRQCIAECNSDHPECKKKTTETTFTPRRLLDLGDSKTASARLIESGEILSLCPPKTQLQYATLSYCWGDSLTMKTTQANKYEHKTTGIDIQSMPATFQDAIHVARKLGIPYLWIDALCIVQDDPDDWEAQAITMCDVFAHSQVTISAAKCSSSAEHFLQRPTDQIVTVNFRSTIDPSISGQYSVRLEQRQRHFPGQQDLAESAWETRAWVWQEEVMSTRQVVFGNKILQFRCSEGIRLEDGRFDSNSFMVLDQSMWFWFNAMKIYSSRALTEASDRLKAIAGAAKFIESRKIEEGKPENYLVGLWQNDDFEWQLRWVCNKPTLSLTELMGFLRDRKKYIAPSWSWASRNTGVDCLVNGTHNAIRVIRTDLQPSHKNAMVSVAFGSSITLSGKFRPIPLKSEIAHRVKDSGRWSNRWEVSGTYGRTDLWLDWVPRNSDVEGRKLESGQCLLLTTIHDNIDALGGLLIAPDRDPKTGDIFYYRVGAFQQKGDRGMLLNLPERELTLR